jgi:uncharacterized protein YukE
MATIDSIMEAAAYFQEANPLDTGVLVVDAEGTIIFRLKAKTFGGDVKIGSKVSGGLALECMKTKSVIRKNVPKEVYGVALKSVSIPLVENDQVVGALVSSISVETQQVLQEATQKIASASEQLTATAEELAATATELAQDLENAKVGGERILNEIKKTDAILQFIHDVADNSNLLGLNAAIEAARAGEAGRGFAVVAEEIRKMAANSSQAVKDIDNIIKTIQKENAQMVKNIMATAQLGERQAAATEEISASIQEFAPTIAEIERISKTL